MFTGEGLLRPLYVWEGKSEHKETNVGTDHKKKWDWHTVPYVHECGETEQTADHIASGYATHYY